MAGNNLKINFMEPAISQAEYDNIVKERDDLQRELKDANDRIKELEDEVDELERFDPDENAIEPNYTFEGIGKIYVRCDNLNDQNKIENVLGAIFKQL